MGHTPIVILDPATGEPLKAGDNTRRFFEASWMHKYNGKYYFSYSTGDTHRLIAFTEHSRVYRVAAADGIGLRNERTFRFVGHGHSYVKHVVFVL